MAVWGASAFGQTVASDPARRESGATHQDRGETATVNVSRRSVGLLHPGEMGAALGEVLVKAGHRVVWASMGRGAQTHHRADAAGLEDVGTATALAKTAEVILSVCPPSAATETATSVGTFDGLYVDANAISPRTARAVAGIVVGNGGTFVDGGLIGRPPHRSGDVRLYLSGPTGAAASNLFATSPVAARIVGKVIGDASALKCAYAAWTKGTTALLLGVSRYARATGVEQALFDEWADSQPHLAAQYELSVAASRAKGWRWIAEMREIATAFESESLPSGFHDAAAEIFERVPDAEDG
ncbi:MAG: DUF1932 domain-containing protein [Acidimicrobiales bacterium]